MTAEVFPKANGQIDFGFNVAVDHARTPLAEVKTGIPGVRALGELMAIQYADDKNKPFNNQSIHARLSAKKWTDISLRNPQYSKEVRTVQVAMLDSREFGESEWVNEEYEIGMENVLDCFTKVEEPNTRAVLQDVLRLYAVSYPDHVFECEDLIQQEVLAEFPQGEEVDPDILAGVSAANLFTLMLEGKITLPGYDKLTRPRL